MDAEEKRLQVERNRRLQYFESMDLVDRAIQGTNDLNKMMHDVLAETLNIFDCDRATLLYPCDPDTANWTVPMECTKSAYLGAESLNQKIPMDSAVAESFKLILQHNGRPVKFDTESEYQVPKSVVERFQSKSFIGMGLFPKHGKAWELGIHQCDHARTWTDDEIILFQEIGRRLSDGLSRLLFIRELQESEAKYRRFVENSNEGILVLGADHRTTFVNARMAEMLGRSEDEIIDQPLTAFMFERDVADHEHHMVLRRQGISEHYERRFCRKDGSELWTLISARVIEGGDGTFQGSLGMFTDITEHKRLEQALQINEERYRYAQDMGSVGSWEYNLQTGYFWGSEEAKRLYGFAPADDAFTVDDVESCIPEKDRVHQALIDLIEKGEEYNLEFEIHPKNSTESRIIASVAELKRDELGEPLKVVGVIQDITERKLAAEELRKSRDLLSTIVEHIPTRVFWKDRASRYLGCNTQFAQDGGLSSQEDFIGKDDFQMVWLDQAAQYQADDKQVMDSNESVLNFEEQQTRLDGSVNWVRTSKVPLHDAGGNVIGMLGIYDDITQKKLAELKLERFNRALRTLSAGNEKLVHATDERSLLQEMCSVIVDNGGYCLAWIGFVEHDEEKSVRVVGSAGDEEGYLESLRISWGGK